MPLPARDVRIAPPPIPKPVTVPSEVFEAIDNMLRPDWHPWQLIDGTSDHKIAGRFYAALGLSQAQIDVIVDTYKALGWQVFSGLPRAGEATVKIQFIPVHLREIALRQRK